jgi:hypothetical protein
MAAGLGFKTFAVGEVLSAANVNGYLMQGVLVFTNATARDAAITSPQEGQFAFTKDNDSLWYYSGSAWVSSGATGDIEGVTAGTGISGGGTSGTVTVTNSMATAIDAKGDLIVGTGADTFSKLTAGTNGYILTADSAEATGLKWAAAAGGGGKVLQVVYAAYNTETNISGAFADIGLSASITPSVNTSKVLVLTNVGVYTSGSGTSSGGCDTKILRGSTSIFQTDTYGQTLYMAQSGGSSTVATGVISMQYLDSPATTSSTTYKVQGSGGTCSFQRLGFYSNMILMEIGA